MSISMTIKRKPTEPKVIIEPTPSAGFRKGGRRVRNFVRGRATYLNNMATFTGNLERFVIQMSIDVYTYTGSVVRPNALTDGNVAKYVSYFMKTAIKTHNKDVKNGN